MLRELQRQRIASAAVEFGALAPMLITFCVGVIDLSFMFQKELQLTSALASGAEYAFTQGQTESGGALTNDVSAFLQAISGVSLASVTVTYNGGLDANAYYCVTGFPAVFSGPYAAGSACSDGSGATAGKFITLQASFAYTPIFKQDKALMPTSYTQSVIVRLQ